MDPKIKKRPWFQFHLSTAFVLMLVAGVILSANCVTRLPNAYERNYLTDILPINMVSSGVTIGWPIRVAYIVKYEAGPLTGNKSFYMIENFTWQNLLLNVFIAFAILAVVHKSCEWWIGYRTAQGKQSTSEQNA